jgi:hypothetical protein
VKNRTPTLRAFANGSVGAETVKQYVLDKLIKQRKPSIEKLPEICSYKPICVYRGKNGVKCAIGHLIPDKDYHLSFEDLKLGDVIRKLHIDISRRKFEFLDKMQTIHDQSDKLSGAAFISHIKKEFKELKF